MKDIISSVARILLDKNIGFCIYRLPDEDNFHLAIEDNYPGAKNGSTFLMTPFPVRSKAKSLTFSVITDTALDSDPFLKFVQNLPSRASINVPLPTETTHQEYFRRANIFLDQIRSGNLKKVVLSRTFNIDKPEKFNPLLTFEHLAVSYPRTFVYLSLHPESGMWMGATPEMLLKKRGTELSTVALAGTQPRKEKGEYYWRSKERDEHQILWDHIENIFGKYECTLVKREGPKTVESGQVAHLKTDFVFREKEATDIKSLINDLHPTPAVGGLPVDEALSCIEKYEGYDRRYYTGVIGQTNFFDTADLYVNLRCMQIGSEKIAIYVGGGITAASDPQEEWEETVVKSKTLLDKLRMV